MAVLHFGFGTTRFGVLQGIERLALLPSGPCWSRANQPVDNARSVQRAAPGSNEVSVSSLIVAPNRAETFALRKALSCARDSQRLDFHYSQEFLNESDSRS